VPYSIALYDSGLGGLTILKKILELNSELDLVYLADTEYLPLGSRTNTEIQERLKVICDYLFRSGSNLVILACNTATVVAIRELQIRWLPNYLELNQSWLGSRAINILGISRPLTENLVDNYWPYRDDPGLIMATPATIRAGFYQAEFLKYGFRNLETIRCHNLAKTIETQDESQIRQSLSETLKLQDLEHLKLVILACTHYPIIKSQIQNFLPRDCLILDQTQAVAIKLLEYIQRHRELDLSQLSSLKLITTSDSRSFKQNTMALFSINQEPEVVII